MIGEVATLAAEMAPVRRRRRITGAVLAKVRDEAADATMGSGAGCCSAFSDPLIRLMRTRRRRCDWRHAWPSQSRHFWLRPMTRGKPVYCRGFGA